MPLGPALVTREGMLAILGVCEPRSPAGAKVVKLASRWRGRLGGRDAMRSLNLRSSVSTRCTPLPEGA